ncbi:hypothetical protein AMAG_07536 [Allomyces macrogynus ATCC 38327]|uniref:Uncharacterized protein n=1 Tax=Allomyces macrogynus (strain ATCC 38327) TaxID=578462 RepID=A0A0L0SIH2_ALLM3|nr:hypothetical protein AMAG_07534 [Allomyces macrogynus ATCC 38327]KNE62303.1 hypothetical protein AMAG_07536 [Allomyces macrogynus ATCC 38327]|eukprot:KNE62301.1 hypothetical protein AMAG_07534 [Allomyces macrogynus ATCC 38327]
MTTSPFSLLRVTPLYASILGLYNVKLIIAIVRQRMRHQVSLGDGTAQFLIEYLDAKEANGGVAAVPVERAPFASKYWNVTVAVRQHGNFIENVPFVLVLGALAELADVMPAKVLHALLGVFTAGRLFHAEFGLNGQFGLGFGRRIGMVTTMAAYTGIAGTMLVQWFKAL